ncbi:MAG: hypothetical protein V1803_00865 [Candidatus Roizmanbacteria bacterium]
MILPNSPYIFLLDIDNTLINTEKLRSAIFHGLAGYLNKRVDSGYEKTNRGYWLRSVSDLYEDIRKMNQMISLDKLSVRIGLDFKLPQQEIFQAIIKIDPSNFLFADSLKLIDELGKNNHLIFYTEGTTHDQLWKIEGSGIGQKIPGYQTFHLGDLRQHDYDLLKDWVDTDEKTSLVLIDSNKKSLRSLVEVFSEAKMPIVLVDDKPEVIRDAIGISKETGINLIPIWMKRGPYAKTVKNIEGALIFDSPTHMKARLEGSLYPKVEIYHWPPQFRK